MMAGALDGKFINLKELHSGIILSFIHLKVVMKHGDAGVELVV